jgi:hypothetical protein
MLDIKIAITENELEVLGEMKVELMQYHQTFAKRLGITDVELIDYSLEKALSTANQRINYIFFGMER